MEIKIKPEVSRRKEIESNRTDKQKNNREKKNETKAGILKNISKIVEMLGRSTMMKNECHHRSYRY